MRREELPHRARGARRFDRGSQRRLSRLRRDVWRERETWLVIGLAVASAVIYFALLECECV